MAIDVANLVGAFNNAHDSLDGTITDLTAILKQGQTGVEMQQQAVQEEASAQNEVTRIEELNKMKKAAANQKAAADFGTNPDAESSILAAVGTNILGIRADLSDRDSMIQQKMDTKFTDDPIQWMLNQFTLPGDVVAYNSRLQKLHEENTILASLQDRTKEQISINNAIDAGTNAQKIAALEKVELAKSAAKVAQAEQNLVQLGLQGVSIRRAVNKDQYEAVLQLHSAQVQDQQLQLSKAHLGLAERTLALQTELKNLQIEDKQDSMEAKAIIQQKLNNVAAVAGALPMSIKEFQMMTGKRRAMMEDAMNDPNIQEGRAGKNTAASLETYNGLNWPGTPGLNIVRRKLTEVLNEVEASDSGWKAKTPDQQNIVLQTAMKTKIKAEYAAIPDAGGIFSAPPLRNVVKIPVVAGLPITKELEPLAKMPDYKTSASDVFAVASNMIEAGKGTPADLAAQITTMYSAINIDNKEQRQYQKLAIDIPTKFNTNVQTGLGFSGSQIIDMTNKARVEDALTRKAAAFKVGKSGFGSGAF